MENVTSNLVPVHSCPNDRVIHADGWQGCLETPAAELAPFAADFEGYADEAPELTGDYEPTDADWDEMALHAEWARRNDELWREEMAAERAAEIMARYGV